jgi:hypothetical protein
MVYARRVFWSDRQWVPYGFSYNSPTIQCLSWAHWSHSCESRELVFTAILGRHRISAWVIRRK